jgi:ubiquinone biosynthesis monooxygenase Coq6
VLWGAEGTGAVRWDAATVGADALGYVAEDGVVEAALRHRLSTLTGVEVLPAVALQGLELPPYQAGVGGGLSGGTAAIVRLKGGRKILARLVVGADGPDSLVRSLADIRMETLETGSSSSSSDGKGPRRELVVAAVRTRERFWTAYQRLLPGGRSIALVPVRGERHGLVAWSVDAADAAQLKDACGGEFAAAVNEALIGGPTAASGGPSMDLLGSLFSSSGDKGIHPEPPKAETRVGNPPQSLPQPTHRAGRFILPRLALIGDAAHSICPVPWLGGATGLADAQALASAVAGAVETGQDIGSPAVLEARYEQPRRRSLAAIRLALTAARLAAGAGGGAAALRGAGLGLLNGSPVLKQTLMRLAMWGV